MRITTQNRNRWLTALAILAVCQAVYVAGAAALATAAPEKNPSESPAPELAPGARPEPQKVLDEARDLTRKGQYEEALQRLLWYFNHALEDHAGQTGVRLSFALSDWIELGRRYPKARQALVEIQQRDQREFAEGHGYFDLFMEVSAINRDLQDEEATYVLFKHIHQTDPDLARQCFRVAEPNLVKHGDYELCLKYLGEPQAAFDRIRQDWERSKQREQHQAEIFQPNARADCKNSAQSAGPSRADDS